MFVDRCDAGRRLADRLRAELGGENAVVVGLPRGGVQVAFEVARVLGAPLDVIAVRKLGVPSQPELGFGALGEDGVRIISQRIVRMVDLSAEQMAAVEQRERSELERRVRRFRKDRPAVELAGRTVIVVDDGVATGGTAQAACQVARARDAARVVLAIPVGAPEPVAALRKVADEVICLHTPDDLMGIGSWYTDFSQITDAQVTELLRRAAGPQVDADPPGSTAEVRIDAAGVRLPGRLTVPGRARAMVVFVHGSGSSRHSPRNRQVADALNAAGLGTLLFDLLTTAEAADRANVFDVDLLADRLTQVTGWLRGQPAAQGLPIGYFGASTGSAAALCAAAEPGSDVAAIVSRGGRPDLAGMRLPAVRAPTLLIVGGQDPVVLDLNQAAQQRLRCEHRLHIIPGATHLFEEPGALEAVARLANDWFTTHLATAAG